jgi:hypothetical protein
MVTVVSKNGKNGLNRMVTVVSLLSKNGDIGVKVG